MANATTASAYTSRSDADGGDALPRGSRTRVSSHEEAAHEKRNWVRLTFDCNDHCIFCLDSDAHDGTIRDREDVKRQILDGRRAGATRLILSGGEPTIHPSYVDFVRLGRLAGYSKIQTVTNGRMFSYGDFLERCLDGRALRNHLLASTAPTRKVHDALVGTKGAFDQEMNGLRRALAHRTASPAGLPIVNVDIVVNRGNVTLLPEMLALFYGMGVKEFDLLQVVPFGRAFTRRARHALLRSGRDASLHPGGARVLEAARRAHLDEPLPAAAPRGLRAPHPGPVQAERRGPRPEGGVRAPARRGQRLDCREPARCRYCYLREAVRHARGRRSTRVDAATRSRSCASIPSGRLPQPPVYGGDPASARRSKEEAEKAAKNGKRVLPLFEAKRAPGSLEALVEESRANTLLVCAPTVEKASAVVARFPAMKNVELDLDDYEGLAGSPVLDKVRRSVAKTPAQAVALLGIDAPFEVTVTLTKKTAEWLLSLPEQSPRIALRQPNYERLTEASAHDVDLADFFARFTHAVPVDNVPACILGRAPRETRRILDTAMMTPDARLEIFRYTRRYILEGYRTKSLRCTTCAHFERCEGMHVNYVRAHGYGVMRPVES